MKDQNAIPSIYKDLFYLILLVVLFYNIGLGHYPLFTPDEGRYSEVAREMVATHDYVTPRSNGVAFLDKPILYYWLQATSIHLFGVTEWALRFFPMLAGVFLTLATYLFGRHIFDRRTGLLSAVILATSPLIFGAAHYANLDLEVACFITISLYLGMMALYRTPLSTACLYGCVIASALAVLTKGLIGLFFPGVILGVMFLYLKRWQQIKPSHIAISTGLFLLIVLPWFIAVQIENPQFFHYFFVTQHITRFLSKAEFNNKTPVWFYLPVILIGFFPWSLFLYHAIKHAILQAVREPKNRVIAIFLLFYMLLIIVFFSMPHSKIVGYILPVFPPLALLVGWYIATQWERLTQWTYAVRTFGALLCCTILFLLILPFLAVKINTHSTKEIAHVLKPRLMANSEVITYFDYFYDLPLYLEKTVAVVANWQDPNIMKRDNWRRELLLGAPFQEVSHVLLSEETFWKKWHSVTSLFVVMSQDDFNTFKTKTKRYNVLKVTPEIVLLSNH